MAGKSMSLGFHMMGTILLTKKATPGFVLERSGWVIMSSTAVSEPRSLRASRNNPLDGLPTYTVECDSR